MNEFSTLSTMFRKVIINKLSDYKYSENAIIIISPLLPAILYVSEAQLPKIFQNYLN